MQREIKVEVRIEIVSIEVLEKYHKYKYILHLLESS